MIARDKYLNELIKAKGNGFPKVITGIRRCGKSYLLDVIYRDYLLGNGVSPSNIFSLDLSLASNALCRDPLNLYEHVVSLTKGSEALNYVFLDEIQEVYPIVNPALTEGKHIKAKRDDEEVVTFVDVILDLASKKNIDLYVTGSNSKMLSSDIVTEFRDKATNIRLSPLSFEEFCLYKGADWPKAIDEYSVYGGMPLAVIKEGEEKEGYLKGLFEATYLRDIVERNHIRKSESLDELSILLSDCIGDLINSESLAKLFEAKTNKRIDADTVSSYIDSFVDSFILSEAFRYDLKGKKLIGSTRKYYYSDLGLRNARLNFAYEDKGKLLENLVYNELIYNGYSVSVGTFDAFGKDEDGRSVRRKLEVDFFAKKGIRQYYVQVCADATNQQTMLREIKPYIALNDQITKIVVIPEAMGERRDKNGYTIIGLSDFLLRYIK